MEKPIRIFVLCSLATLLLSACSGISTEQPSPESLVQRHMELAYSGKGLGIQPSITMEGRLIIESYDVNAPLTMKVEAPDKRYFKTEVMGQEVIRSCKGGRCWAREIDAPMQELHGAQLAFMTEIADFYRLQHLDRYYRHLKTTGLTEFNNKKAYELQLIRNNGSHDKWYFAKDSGLWLGGTWRLPRAMGGAQVTQYFADYQTFNGIQLPTEITDVTPEQVSKAIIEAVSFEDIPDSDFEISK